MHSSEATNAHSGSKENVAWCIKIYIKTQLSVHVNWIMQDTTLKPDHVRVLVEFFFHPKPVKKTKTKQYYSSPKICAFSVKLAKLHKSNRKKYNPEKRSLCSQLQQGRPHSSFTITGHMIHSSACSGSQRSRSLMLHHVTSSKDYFPCSILLRHLLNSLLCGHAHIPFAATPSPPTSTASRHWLLISSDDPMTSPVGWHMTSLIGSASVISHNWGSLFTTSVFGCTFIWTSAYIQTHFFAVIFLGHY